MAPESGVEDAMRERTAFSLMAKAIANLESLLKEIERAGTIEDLSRAIQTVTYEYADDFNKRPMRKFFTLAHKKLAELRREE